MKNGYAWIFPFDDELRLGLSIPKRSTTTISPKRVFLRWLSRFPLGPESLTLESGTINCAYMGHRFGRIALAGDAAGLASPVTGEGIAQALVSGTEVAREIIDPTYRSAEIPKLARRHRRAAHTLALWGVDRLMTLAPLILRAPPIRRSTMERFIF